MARRRRRVEPARRRRPVRGHRGARAHERHRTPPVAPRGPHASARRSRARLGRSRRVRDAGGAVGHRRDVGHPGHGRCGSRAEHRGVRPGDRRDPRRGRADRRGDGGGLHRARRRSRARVPHVGAEEPLRLGRAAARGCALRHARTARRRRRGVRALRRAASAGAGRRRGGAGDPPLGARDRARDAGAQGHGARRHRPRHPERRLVLPERHRLGILRPHPPRRVPAVADLDNGGAARRAGPGHPARRLRRPLPRAGALAPRR